MKDVDLAAAFTSALVDAQVGMLPPHHAVDLSFEGEVSMTRQSEKDSTDVNKIVERFARTGELPSAGRQGFYGDVSEIGDFMDLQNRIVRGKTLFAALPVEAQRRFNFEPEKFFEMLGDPGRVEEVKDFVKEFGKPAKAATFEADGGKPEEAPAPAAGSPASPGPGTGPGGAGKGPGGA